MINVESIVIKEFRGVRSLKLALGGKNFAICGPNGTGKSGIVDALDFALTGNISRLSGQGTGALSVREHGPHVDSRTKPKLAVVELTVNIPSLNKTATITRNVHDAKKPLIVPDEPAIRKIFDDVAVHPEFVLSRRELIRYVLAEPAKRSQEVQALLRLNEVEHLRGLFSKIANASKAQLRSAADAKKIEGEKFIRGLALPALNSAAILEKVNEYRNVLRLAPVQALEKDSVLNQGVEPGEADAVPRVKIAKKAALDDLATFRTWIDYISSDVFLGKLGDAQSELEALKADEAYLRDSSQAAFLEKALENFDGENCPVCDTRWDSEEFTEILQKKISKFEEVVARRRKLDEQLRSIVGAFQALRACAELAASLGGQLVPVRAVGALQQYVTRLKNSEDSLRKLLPMTDSIAAVEGGGKISAEAMAEFEQIYTAVRDLPEASAQENARVNLALAQERFESYQRASRDWRAADAEFAMAQKISEAYGRVTTSSLETIYKSVEGTFRELYRMVNSDDEANFEAKLQPSLNKLGFDVDFYGRGFFPPSAYHSEGHQDGMGLCLYLALMRHLAGDGFTFAVLDDVLMSVDAGHRREVSQMLKSQFPTTQFIFTTHDDIWLKHMKTVGLVDQKHSIHFRTWNVDIGPTEWDDRDVWLEIENHLTKNNVRDAAALLRHYLEYFAKEVCHSLRAPVEFSGDARYNLGDLLPAAVAKFRKSISAAKAAAQSWGRQFPQELLDLEVAVIDAAKVSNVEQWQVNAAVHYNEWANLHKNDFAPVVDAYKKLVQVFNCASCLGVIYSTPSQGSAEAVRCACGQVNFSLVKK
ncbi:ATP-binding protein [Variovorax paradoxus]|uniref:ATP-binding protein n=1 Tax=Variovorax paradoxus TaxID=34073 RepID=UPI0024806E95|nr:AAA family ATPase [Variovorax paradoxus]WGT65010.1 AAA family ATPase [Variovorax paradoxus]